MRFLCRAGPATIQCIVASCMHWHLQMQLKPPPDRMAVLSHLFRSTLYQLNFANQKEKNCKCSFFTWWCSHTPCLCPYCPSTSGTSQTHPRWQDLMCLARLTSSPVVMESESRYTFNQLAYHWKEYCADVLGGVPPFTRQLPGLGVVHRWVKDGYTQVAVLRCQRFRRFPGELYHLPRRHWGATLLKEI